MDLKMGIATVEGDAGLKKKVLLGARDLLVGARFDGVQLVAMSVFRRTHQQKLKANKAAVRHLPQPWCELLTTAQHVSCRACQTISVQHFTSSHFARGLLHALTSRAGPRTISLVLVKMRASQQHPCWVLARRVSSSLL